MLKLIALLAVAVTLCASVRAPGEGKHVKALSEKHVKAPGSYVRGCYYTNWSHYRWGRALFYPEDYIPGLCTHIMFAFGWMNDDYTIREYDEQDVPCEWCGRGYFQRVTDLKEKDPNVKILLSVGGWTFGTELFQGMTQNAKTRKTFIDSALPFVRLYAFDGLDLDWEYPSGAVDIVNLSLFFKELRAAVDAEAASSGKERLLVTCATAAGKSNIDNGYDPTTFRDYIDFMSLMSYDYHGGWETFTGMHSQLYAVPNDPIPEFNTDFAANYWVQKGMPKEKIIIGVGTYGRGWALADTTKNGIFAEAWNPSWATNYVNEAGTAAYFEFCEFLAKGAVRVYVKEAEEPYLIHNKDQWFSYDDVESITAKMQYVKNNGFGGAFVWCLDMDDFNGQCTNGGGRKYPLIGTIAKELAGIDIK